MTFLIAICSPILVVFYGLELFVGAIQAFVFGTLTLVFASMAVAGHGEEHAEGAQHEGAHH
jgi:F-type H+-transporting ATPase subunit a